MPNYLLHQKRDGTPVGVYSETADYYNPLEDQLRAEGREVVYGKLPQTPWSTFIERLASLSPSPTMQWDVYTSTSNVLEEVLDQAARDTGEHPV